MLFEHMASVLKSGIQGSLLFQTGVSVFVMIRPCTVCVTIEISLQALLAISLRTNRRDRSPSRNAASAAPAPRAGRITGLVAGLLGLLYLISAGNSELSQSLELISRGWITPPSTLTAANSAAIAPLIPLPLARSAAETSSGHCVN